MASDNFHEQFDGIDLSAMIKRSITVSKSVPQIEIRLNLNCVLISCCFTHTHTRIYFVIREISAEEKNNIQHKTTKY